MIILCVDMNNGTTISDIDTRCMCESTHAATSCKEQLRLHQCSTLHVMLHRCPKSITDVFAILHMHMLIATTTNETLSVILRLATLITAERSQRDPFAATVAAYPVPWLHLKIVPVDTWPRDIRLAVIAERRATVFADEELLAVPILM
jgi:hypothetical protein